MPFTFKLSQRLARMRQPALLASPAALAAGLAQEITVVGPAQPGAEVPRAELDT